MHQDSVRQTPASFIDLQVRRDDAIPGDFGVLCYHCSFAYQRGHADYRSLSNHSTGFDHSTNTYHCVLANANILANHAVPADTSTSSDFSS
jgi:hypothetical protein